MPEMQPTEHIHHQTQAGIYNTERRLDSSSGQIKVQYNYDEL